MVLSSSVSHLVHYSFVYACTYTAQLKTVLWYLYTVSVLLFKVTKEVDSKDVRLVQPVPITSLDSISRLLRGGKLHEEIPT